MANEINSSFARLQYQGKSEVQMSTLVCQAWQAFKSDHDLSGLQGTTSIIVQHELGNTTFVENSLNLSMDNRSNNSEIMQGTSLQASVLSPVTSAIEKIQFKFQALEIEEQRRQVELDQQERDVGLERLHLINEKEEDLILEAQNLSKLKQLMYEKLMREESELAAKADLRKRERERRRAELDLILSEVHHPQPELNQSKAAGSEISNSSGRSIGPVVSPVWTFAQSPETLKDMTHTVCHDHLVNRLSSFESPQKIDLDVKIPSLQHIVSSEGININSSETPGFKINLLLNAAESIRIRDEGSVRDPETNTIHASECDSYQRVSFKEPQTLYDSSPIEDRPAEQINQQAIEHQQKPIIAAINYSLHDSEPTPSFDGLSKHANLELVGRPQQDVAIDYNLLRRKLVTIEDTDELISISVQLQQRGQSLDEELVDLKQKRQAYQDKIEHLRQNTLRDLKAKVDRNRLQQLQEEQEAREVRQQAYMVERKRRECELLQNKFEMLRHDIEAASLSRKHSLLTRKPEQSMLEESTNILPLHRKETHHSQLRDARAEEGQKQLAKSASPSIRFLDEFNEELSRIIQESMEKSASLF